MSWMGDVWMKSDSVVQNHQEMYVRGIVAGTSPALALIELNKVASFNMMDLDLAADLNYVLDVVCYCVSVPTSDGQRCSPSLIMQGAGPHFCPGGNPRPLLRSSCAGT
jgi:hypothetical protein